jgi:DNA-binding response OmpR family regulator
LLIDDEKDLVEMIQYQLSEEGYKTIAAYDGLQGLEKIKEVEPGLIILDINLPKMNGLEFYSKICTPHGRSRYPVLVMTARSNLKKVFKDVEVDGFLAKPFEIDELLN